MRLPFILNAFFQSRVQTNSFRSRSFSVDTMKGVDLKSTVSLPRTTLPTRSSPAQREPELTEALTSILYRRLQSASSLVEKKHFILHDGPPYANGNLHMGHFLNKVLKDIANRSALLENLHVIYVPGWDCHGMPIELKALEEMRRESKDLSSKNENARKETPLPSALEIRKRARSYAEAAIKSQRDDFVRWGILADWDLNVRGEKGSSYVTMDAKYESAQLLVFSKLLARGLVFRDLKPVYWSPSSSSALAEAELEYRDDHESEAAYVTFPFADIPKQEELIPSRKFLFEHLVALRPSVVTWTTTPWTLPANVALAVHPDLHYCIILRKDIGAHYLIAQSRLESISSLIGGSTNVSIVLQDILGSDLIGCLFSHPLTQLSNQTSIIIPAKHVTADSGSGIVHTASGHGVEDYEAVKAWNQTRSSLTSPLPLLCPVDDHGRFESSCSPLLAGKHIFSDGLLAVIELLKAAGSLFSGPQKHKHRYPYDWRTKKPVIIRATKQWFLRISELMPELLASSHRMHPIASEARFLGMLKARTQEWCISRQRSWGVPIPALYRSDTKEPFMTQESVEHIQRILEANGGTDSWWTLSANELLLPSKREEAQMLGITYEKGIDTLDVWFDSGTSWSSAWANSPIHLKTSPAPTTALSELKGVISDVVIEGSDQHRGWFQSSLITSIAATGRAPFKMIVSHGFVLDQHFRKMSKSLGNVISPADIISGNGVKTDRSGKSSPGTEPLGADVLRYWVASSDYTADVSIGPKALTTASDALKKVRSTLRFLLASLHDFKEFQHENGMTRTDADKVLSAWKSPVVSVLSMESPLSDNLGILERGILHRLSLFERHVRTNLSAYNYSAVVSAINTFSAIDLSASFFDFSKDRLYCDSDVSNTQEVHQQRERAIRRQVIQSILWETLRVLTRAVAPIAVYTSQDIFEHSSFFLSSKDSQQRFPSETATLFDAGSWNMLPDTWLNFSYGAKWANALSLRSQVNAVIEVARKRGDIGASSEVEVELFLATANSPLAVLISELEQDGSLLDLLLVSRASVEYSHTKSGIFNDNSLLSTNNVQVPMFAPHGNSSQDSSFGPPIAGLMSIAPEENVIINVRKARGQKCLRCRLVREEVARSESALCLRCKDVTQEKLKNR
jgi:isoleucyl-tRNA synthetase